MRREKERALEAQRRVAEMGCGLPEMAELQQLLREYAGYASGYASGCGGCVPGAGGFPALPEIASPAALVDWERYEALGGEVAATLTKARL